MTLFSWPNAISMLRVPLAAAFIVVDSTPARVGIAAAAGLSDLVDGKLARSQGWTTRTGELLDPITDRVFILGALSTFVASGELRGPELLLLLARDIYTTGAFGTAAILRLPVTFSSRWSGKLVTTLQVATVLALLLRQEWARALISATGVAGLYAIIDYTRAGILDLRAGAAAP
jgi:phosphatidylglycerophosphate synthase